MYALRPALFSLTLAFVFTEAVAQNAPAAPAAASKPADPKADPKADAKADPKADPKKAAEPAKNAAAGEKPGDKKSTDSKASGGKTTADKDAAKDATTADGKEAANDTKKSAKADAPPCVVAEFRAIGMDTHDTTKRRTQAMNWLKRRAKQCSVDQLLMIRNNRSQWMGTADSAALAATVDALLEAIAADNPQVATILYGTPPAPASGGDGGGPGK